jgi:hypothetical protein
MRAAGGQPPKLVINDTAACADAIKNAHRDSSVYYTDGSVVGHTGSWAWAR